MTALRLLLKFYIFLASVVRKMDDAVIHRMNSYQTDKCYKARYLLYSDLSGG